MTELHLNNSDTSDAHPLDHIRDELDWHRGLWTWGQAWRREAMRLAAFERQRRIVDRTRGFAGDA